MPLRLLVKLLVLFSLAAFSSWNVAAQVPDPVVSAEAPRSGAGHHYIGMGAETVNPADGSLSFDLPLQPPAGRQISFRFGIRFAGTEQYFPKNWPTSGQLQWISSTDYGVFPLQIGGWSYDVPNLTATTSVFWSATSPNNGCPNGVCTFGTNICFGNDSYVFRGLDGNQYSLALGSLFPGSKNFINGYCPASPNNIKGSSNQHGILATYTSNTLTTVVDAAGTTYQFGGGSGQPTEPGPPYNPFTSVSLATTITDRNGNQLVLNGGYVDSAGRTAVSWSGIGNTTTGDQITVAGLGPVTVKWTTTSVSFPETGFNLDPSPNTCTLATGTGSTIKVVSEIDLPNGQKYSFLYDGTYGKVKKITFPDGGYVRYLWGLYPSAKGTQGHWSAGEPSQALDCDFVFDVPAVTDRYVSYDGTTEALHQQFSYAPSIWTTGAQGPTWNTKQTTVTSTDLLTNQVTKTIYTYVPATTDNNVWVPSPLYSRIVPVESNILYQDGSGKTFKEVNKTWLNPHVMTAEQTILYDSSGNRSVGSAIANAYNGDEQIIGKSEYGFQTEGSCGTNCPSGLNSGYIGPLRRQTSTVYTPFSVHIANAPASVTVSDGSNNTASQTLFTYDQNSLQPSNAINLSNPGSARANATTLQRLISGSTYATTTYQYYDTGQVYKMTDPCGNTPCTDVTGTDHTTTYDYTDHYASGTGTPGGQTFTYLTHVTRPNTGVAHSASYTWGYNDGLIRSTTDDQNSLTSTYAYADPLLRLTQIVAPDGGQTNVTYNDTLFSPTVTTTKTMNSTQSVVSIAVNDGLGHTVKTKLCEDGTTACTQPIFTDTTYDGLGHVWKHSNPYRTTADATYGVTTTSYDAISRKLTDTYADGSVLTTAYTGPTTTVTDPTGRARRSRVDGLGFLVEVDEPGYGTTPATPGTGSATIGGSEQSRQYVCGPNNQMCTMYDGGTITVTISGIAYTASYSQTSTPSTIASALATSMNGGTLVTATASGNVVTFTARTTGSATNYSLTTSVGWNQNFASPSFSATLSGSAMTGGANASTGYSLSTPALTLYTYDTLGNLLCSVQKATDTTAFSTCAAASATWRPRSFTYDMLSHMLTSTNPEVGTLTYTYDANGNVSTKKDARNITSTYTYDNLNRNKSITYSNGDPSISINYDESTCLSPSPTPCQNVGQRTSMTDAAGSEKWSYHTDNTGSDLTKRNVHVNQRTTSGITKTSTYYLDVAGNLTQIVYPTSRTVNYAYDNAGRPATAADSANGITYASGTCASAGNSACYAPQGALASAKIGVSSVFTGGLVLTNTYNTRLQPNELKASSTGGNAFDISYNFVDPVSGKNAGHVYGITNNLDTTRSQIFGYDPLNRITSAQTTSTHATSAAHCWGETYTYDAWGNLITNAATTDPSYTGCLQESGFTKTADANNHLSGFGYDVSGNTLNDGTVTNYAWDGESQLKSAAGVTYAYDGQGRRVSKSNGKLYWYGSGGEILAETTASGATTNEYIFFAGKRVALLPAGSTAQFYAEDFLGSTRVVTTNTGIVCYDADFYPYGGERTPYVNTCTQNAYKFEGKERDAETGNDDFGARYYSNRFGRWLSADWSNVPAPIPYANLTNPQTLNLYSMVADDPESFADLDGHAGWECEPNSEKQKAETAHVMEAGISAAASSSAEAGVNKALMNILLSLANAGMNGGVVSRETFAPLQGSNRDEKGAMLATDLTVAVVSGGGGLARAPEALSAAERATELANTMGKTKNFVTIAVTETEQGTRVVSSSENALRPAVRAALQPGEIAVKGAGHAEVTGVNGARQLGLTPTGVAASRPICPSCATYLQIAKIALLSILR